MGTEGPIYGQAFHCSFRVLDRGTNLRLLVDSACCQEGAKPKLNSEVERCRRLLTATVEREGGQSAFAKHHSVDRAYLNMIQRFPLRRLSAFWAETQSAPS